MYQGTCVVCQKPFTAKKKRMCCDRSCAATFSLSARGIAPWHKEELALLEKKLGHQPISDIIQAIQDLDRTMGWSIRTATAIKVKIKKLGLSMKCTFDNLTSGELARKLNVNRDRVESWVEKYGLPHRKVDGYKGAIRLDEFRKWASSNPQKLAGIEQSRLEELLGPDLAAVCSNLPLPTQGRPQPVKCLETGETFPSFRAAAAANNIDKQCIAGAVNRNGKSVGRRWKALNTAFIPKPPAYIAERQQRIDICNQLLQTIASCGRKFFLYQGRVAWFKMDNRRHHLWFIDECSQKAVYVHSDRGEWKGFTGGGTLQALVRAMKAFIMCGRPLRQVLGPFPDWLCGGDLWGYGEDMEIVRQKAIALGIYAIDTEAKSLAEVS